MFANFVDSVLLYQHCADERDSVAPTRFISIILSSRLFALRQRQRVMRAFNSRTVPTGYHHLSCLQKHRQRTPGRCRHSMWSSLSSQRSSLVLVSHADRSRRCLAVQPTSYSEEYCRLPSRTARTRWSSSTARLMARPLAPYHSPPPAAQVSAVLGACRLRDLATHRKGALGSREGVPQAGPGPDPSSQPVLQRAGPQALVVQPSHKHPDTRVARTSPHPRSYNTGMQTIKLHYSYKLLLVRAEAHPEVLEEARPIFETVLADVEEECVDRSRLQPIHGDFWTGK